MMPHTLSDVYAVIMAGGQGTRLWPYSNADEPKQFLKFGTEYSLFQRTVQRLLASGFKKLIVVTCARQKSPVLAQAQEIGITLDAVLVEPAARGTAVAYSVASQFVQEQDPEGQMVVVPVDGFFGDIALFADVLTAAVQDVAPGGAGLIGVVPDQPHGGFGYLIPEKTGHMATSGRITAFVEKPSLEEAEVLITESKALWNCGILIAHARTVSGLIRTHAKDLFVVAQAAVRARISDGNVHTFPSAVYSLLEKADFEKSVLQNHDRLRFQSYHGQWSDVGSFTAIDVLVPPGEDGNIHVGAHKSVRSKNCVLVSPDHPIAVIGLEDVIVSVRDNHVLVASRDSAQAIGKVSKEMEVLAMETFTEGPDRPWGRYRILKETDNFKVKEITVKPGGILSLQAHRYRSEHWTIVQGRGLVHLDGQDHLLGENESIFIPVGAVHRIANRTNETMIFIEVQHGTYLGEDDIVRFEDVYERPVSGSKGPANTPTLQ